MTTVLTHRGIATENEHPFTESSREAFVYFLEQGYGLEFDVRLTADKVLVISHDENLTRTSLEAVSTPIGQLTATEFLAIPLHNGTTISCEQLLELITKHGKQNVIHALHLKGTQQTTEVLEALIRILNKHRQLPLFVFDVTLGTAKYLKQRLPRLQLGASVTHDYDIVRYNDCVEGTLIDIDTACQENAFFDWAWIDEWDRTAAKNTQKNLHTIETYSRLREADLKIAVVSPELHRTSPHLLGGESHPDAEDMKTLQERWSTILTLKPDTVCTDYPSRLKKLNRANKSA